MDKNVLGFLRRVHFVGIGGIGMSGIAEVLHDMGFIVSGSDLVANSNVERLRGMGITIHIGHKQENVANAEVAIYSSAVTPDNPELLYARDNYIPVISRGEMLAELMRMYFAVAVAGSHGKTTTTSMISEIVIADGQYDPTTIIGGRLNRTGSNARLGKHSIMIAESDESDRSFLMLQPSIAVVTNIDREHMESYRDFGDVKRSFAEFANKVPFYGVAVLCIDDPNVVDVVPMLGKRFITYGVKAKADVRGLNIKKEGFSVSFDVEQRGKPLGRVCINQPGDHIVLDGLAAIAVALEMRIEFQHIADALEKFEGVQRRLSVRYKSDDLIVLDDYGHHPTEIRATLKAVRDATPNSRICAIFQPHRYTRTENLMLEFAKSFFDADCLLVSDIYAASEQPIEGIDSLALISEIKKRGFKDVQHLSALDDAFGILKKHGLDNLVIITLGAGNITNFSHKIADFCKAEREGGR